MLTRLSSIGALMMALGIALGAFGAHALKNVLDPYAMSIWEKASLYHLIHGVALTCLPRLTPSPSRASWALLCAGTVIFSGSLYLLAVTGIKILGAITPIGGTLLIAGWCWIGLEKR